nr:transposase [Pyxidicoccus trucidator]
MVRTERRRALGGYVTGLLLDGERKSSGPMAARLVEEPGQTEAMRQRLQQCVSGGNCREFREALRAKGLHFLMGIQGNTNGRARVGQDEHGGARPIPERR